MPWNTSPTSALLKGNTQTNPSCQLKLCLFIHSEKIMFADCCFLLGNNLKCKHSIPGSIQMCPLYRYLLRIIDWYYFSNPPRSKTLKVLSATKIYKSALNFRTFFKDMYCRGYVVVCLGGLTFYSQSYMDTRKAKPTF